MMIRTTSSSISVKPLSSLLSLCLRECMQFSFMDGYPDPTWIGSACRKSGCLREVEGRGFPRARLRQRPVPVTEPADGLDRRRSRRVGGELSPEVADVELHLVAGGCKRGAPNELPELVVTQYLVRVTNERG